MHEHVTTKYVPAVLFILILATLVFLLSPFFTAILGSIVLAILFAPLYKLFVRKLKNKSVSAGLVCLIVILVVFIPLILVFQILFVESTALLSNPNLGASVLELQQSISSFFDQFITIPLDLTFLVEKVVSVAGTFIQDVITSLPSKILVAFVTLFLFYYLLKDGARITRIVFTLFSVSESHKTKLVKEFHGVVNGVVYGQVITAIFQAFVATIGYIIFGVNLPFLVGFITIFFAFLPLFGTAIVWFPISLFFLIQGQYVQGIGLLLYGILVVGVVDNLIRPKLISGRTKMHPALVLLGVVSGLQAFGILGIFIGPLFIAAGKELIKYYMSDSLDKKKTKSVSKTKA